MSESEADEGDRRDDPQAHENLDGHRRTVGLNGPVIGLTDVVSVFEGPIRIGVSAHGGTVPKTLTGVNAERASGYPSGLQSRPQPAQPAHQGRQGAVELLEAVRQALVE